MTRILSLLFLALPAAFSTATKDPFLIKETLFAACLLAAAALQTIRLFEKRAPVVKPPLAVPILLFLFSILLSLKDALHKPLVLESLFTFSLLALLYWIAEGTAEKRKILAAVAAASALAGLYGLLQYFGFDFMTWQSHWDRRPSATFGNPNFAAGWWLMTLPLFTAEFLADKKKGRWRWAALALLMAANLYLGRTRGAWLAAALAYLSTPLLVSLFSGALPDRRRFLFPGLFLLVFAGAAGFAALKINRSQDPSIQERVFKWKTGWAILRGHPFFGVGAENLKVHFALYQSAVKKTMPIPLKGTSESNLHNEYLQIASELGLTGLFSFLSIFALWFWRWRRKLPEIAPEEKLRSAGSAAAILAFLLYSLTNFPLRILPNAALLFFLLAGGEKREAAKEPAAKNTALRLLAPALALLAFYYTALPRFRADRLRLLADQARERKDFAGAIQNYSRALELDFYHSERTAYDLGETYRMTGRIPEALAAYQSAVRLRNYGEVYNNIGNCYYLLNQPKQAAENWSTALSLGLPDPTAQEQTEKNLKIIQQGTLAGGTQQYHE